MGIALLCVKELKGIIQMTCGPICGSGEATNIFSVVAMKERAAVSVCAPLTAAFSLSVPLQCLWISQGAWESPSFRDITGDCSPPGECLQVMFFCMLEVWYGMPGERLELQISFRHSVQPLY